MSERIHEKAVKRSIDYIETHLREEITLKEVSRKSIFSAPHFYRIFLSKVGITVSDYIRRRRLAKAGVLLAQTDMRILDIALEYRFQSQEAFSRAFKKTYLLTPHQYRVYSQTLNKGGNTMSTISKLPGWTITGQLIQEYEVDLDRTEVHMGRASATVKAKPGASESGFATLMQMFASDHYRGQRLKLSAFVKGKNITGWAGLWMRVDHKNGEMLKFDNMQNRQIKHTSEWSQYDIVLDIPSDSYSISFGVLQSGGGQVWVDNFRFEVVDEKTPTTDESIDEALPELPINLNFENAMV